MAGATATINPSSDFHPGELVQTTVTDGVTTDEGGVTPHVWQFRAKVNIGGGVFTQSSNNLGDSASYGVSLGDVDGDSDLDAFVVNTVSEGSRVWLNDGSGSFSDGSNHLNNNIGTWSVDLGSTHN